VQTRGARTPMPIELALQPCLLVAQILRVSRSVLRGMSYDKKLARLREFERTSYSPHRLCDKYSIAADVVGLCQTRGCSPDCNALQPSILAVSVIRQRCCGCMSRIYANRYDDEYEYASNALRPHARFGCHIEFARYIVTYGTWSRIPAGLE
jgi:hypothetical protein